MSLCVAVRMTASVGASLLAIQALQKHREQARSYKHLQSSSYL
jgi:hypothetical protein